MHCVPVMNYTGGIIDLPKESRRTDHIISIVGWSSENNRRYWIVRNSWGSSGANWVFSEFILEIICWVLKAIAPQPFPQAGPNAINLVI